MSHSKDLMIGKVFLQIRGDWAEGRPQRGVLAIGVEMAFIAAKVGKEAPNMAWLVGCCTWGESLWGK